MNNRDNFTKVFLDQDQNRTIRKDLQKTKTNSRTEYEDRLTFYIKNYKMKDLYETLHWNFVLPLEGTESDPKNVIAYDIKIAVIVFLYYEDRIEHNLKYLLNVSQEWDLYIITKNPKIKRYLSNDKYWAERVIFVYEKNNRGRDVSALLIATKPFIHKYEYVCFIHDKKTTGGSDAEAVGDDFNDMLFENLLGSEYYIRLIIKTFEKERMLGVLAAPEAYHGAYFSVLGREWTNNTENTQKLAKELGIKTKIFEDSPPYILSTAFWCRTKAIMPLFRKKWRYEDFPDEPLKMDGTLNHAVERLIMYSAQDEGYYSGIVMNSDYAASYISNINILLKDALGVCRIHTLLRKHSDLFSDKGRRLLKFCDDNSNHVFLYGTGGSASRIAEFLEFNGVSIDGYIVSDGRLEKNSFLSKPVYEVSDLASKNDEDIAVVVTVSAVLRCEVIACLEQNNFCNYYEPEE